MAQKARSLPKVPTKNHQPTNQTSLFQLKWNRFLRKHDSMLKIYKFEKYDCKGQNQSKFIYLAQVYLVHLKVKHSQILHTVGTFTGQNESTIIDW